MTMLVAGDELEPVVIESVDPNRMKTMALLLRDPNPIHWDTVVTERLGLGDRAINQGPINLSYLVGLAARAAGGGEHVRHVSVRFAGNVFAGDRVTCRGRVTAVDEDAGTAELELTADVDGRPVLAGVATVANSTPQGPTEELSS
jgi:acyl dehydratase